MRDLGVGSWPRRRARRSGASAAVVWGDRTLTYTDLDQRSARLAHALRERGIGPGDRVAYLGRNHPTFLDALFAAARAGAVFVPLNFRLTQAELEYCLADSGARLLLHRSEFGQAFPVERLDVEGERYARLVGAGPVADIDDAITADDPCLLMYTSGTSGPPKGALLTHGNILWNCLSVLIDADLTSADSALVVSPLFHAAGLNMITLPVLIKGGTVYLAESFVPGEVLALIEQHAITYLYGVPTVFHGLAEHELFDKTDLSSLRLLMSGGAPAPDVLVRRYLDRGLPLIQGYGMTEVAPGATMLSPDHAEAGIGTVGTAHFFADVAVLDAAGAPLPPGAVGEVAVSGPNVFPGYWGQASPAPAPAGTWWRTGDLGALDDSGRLRIEGRMKDLIISGGENISPHEIENLLAEDASVAECAVIAVSDPYWGEVGLAVIVPRAGCRSAPEEVLGRLSGRIASYKIPKAAVFVAELPRNGSGKILKRQLREDFAGWR